MNIADQLRRDEGWRALPYTDTVGKVTIGYGFNLTDVGLLANEGDFILQNRLKIVTGHLQAMVPFMGELNDARQGVLINMAYNMGVGGVLAFKDMLAKLQAADYAGAAAAMLDSKWATQVGDRAQRLSKQLITGEWQ